MIPRTLRAVQFFDPAFIPLAVAGSDLFYYLSSLCCRWFAFYCCMFGLWCAQSSVTLVPGVSLIHKTGTEGDTLDHTMALSLVRGFIALFFSHTKLFQETLLLRSLCSCLSVITCCFFFPLEFPSWSAHFESHTLHITFPLKLSNNLFQLFFSFFSHVWSHCTFLIWVSLEFISFVVV